MTADPDPADIHDRLVQLNAPAERSLARLHIVLEQRAAFRAVNDGAPCPPVVDEAVRDAVAAARTSCGDLMDALGDYAGGT